MQTPASTLAIAALLALIVWRVYARFRRMVGRQRLSKVRPWITLTIFPLLVVLLATSAVAHPERLLVLAAGLVLGGGLAVFGLRHTRFEPTPQGLFYTPNAHLGIALSTLFVARIVYRFIELGSLDPSVFAAGNPHAADFARSPLTLAVFGLLAGYYVGYAIGLLRWRAGVMRAKREREAAASAAFHPAVAGVPDAAAAPSTESTNEITSGISSNTEVRR